MNPSGSTRTRLFLRLAAVALVGGCATSGVALCVVAARGAHRHAALLGAELPVPTQLVMGPAGVVVAALVAAAAGHELALVLRGMGESDRALRLLCMLAFAFAWAVLTFVAIAMPAWDIAAVIG